MKKKKEKRRMKTKTDTQQTIKQMLAYTRIPGANLEGLVVVGGGIMRYLSQNSGQRHGGRPLQPVRRMYSGDPCLHTQPALEATISSA